MFSLVVRLGENLCHQCGEKIESVETFSIEHKTPWQTASDPIAAFFDVENISFSHLLCNIKAGARPNKIYVSKAEARRVHSRTLIALAKKRLSNAARDRRK